MADEALFARDALVTDFVFLDAKQTVTQAHEKLTQAGATYGIVANANGVPVAVTTVGALATISNPNITLQAAPLLPAFVVGAEALLDQTVSFSAQTLVEHPEMAGLVVEDQGKVVGVLTRQTIRKHAQRIKTRGGDITELAGVPQTRVKYFVCPEGDYKKLVVLYDPDDPPVCPVHTLVLVEQN
jgi:CBS domain-containing protein